jgi:hypothetical protein
MDWDPKRSSRRISVNGGARALKRALSSIALRADAPVEADAEDEQSASPLGEVHVHPVGSFSDTILTPGESEWLRPRSRAVFSQGEKEAVGKAILLGAPPTYDESHEHGPARAHFEHIAMRSSSAELQREEDGWTGEWVGAVGNMDDVMRSLRGLKVK